MSGRRPVEVGAALVSEVLNIKELRQHPAPSPDWLEVDITVVKTIENHPKQNNVSCPVGVDITVVKTIENHPKHIYVSCPVGGGTGRD